MDLQPVLSLSGWIPSIVPVPATHSAAVALVMLHHHYGADGNTFVQIDYVLVDQPEATR
jgi:hypothetical protein